MRRLALCLLPLLALPGCKRTTTCPDCPQTPICAECPPPRAEAPDLDENAVEEDPLTDVDKELPDPEGKPLTLENRPKPPGATPPEAFGPPSTVVAAPAPVPVLKIHFMNIGQGDATLIECPGGNEQRILVDAGSKSGGGPNTRTYLYDDLAIRQINDLVVTHPDGDHYNVLDDVLEGVQVDEVWAVGTQGDYSGPGGRYLAAQDEARRVTWLGRGGPYRDTTQPQARLPCGLATVWIAAAGVTGGSSSWTKNTSSIVLMISYGEFDAVLTGDATFVTENQMINWHGGWLEAEVLKMGHHGSSATSTGDNWATIVQPLVAIASASASNNYGHPAQAVVERLEAYVVDAGGSHDLLRFNGPRNEVSPRAYDLAIYNTASDGHIRIEADPDSFTVYP